MGMCTYRVYRQVIQNLTDKLNRDYLRHEAKSVLLLHNKISINQFLTQKGNRMICQHFLSNPFSFFDAPLDSYILLCKSNESRGKSTKY